MQKLYPLTLADRSWDNVGLLLEPPFQPPRKGNPKVLLTIDLTTSVAEEALQENSNVETIVTYRTYLALTNDRSDYISRIESTYAGGFSAGVIVEIMCKGDWSVFAAYEC
jgi:putative NIF3 family GTP cyclohydrolase 1 type 2